MEKKDEVYKENNIVLNISSYGKSNKEKRSMLIDTKDKDFKLKFAKEEDVGLILEFIKALAEYENLLDKVVATEEILSDALFRRKAAEVIIGEYKGEPVGFVLFFHNFSTFLGQVGIYIEDLFVIPEMRGKGFGKIMLSYLGKLAKERGCGRLDWQCLNWNEPSMKFYKKMGAVPLDEWITFRLSGERLDDIAKN